MTPRELMAAACCVAALALAGCGGGGSASPSSQSSTSGSGSSVTTAPPPTTSHHRVHAQHPAHRGKAPKAADPAASFSPFLVAQTVLQLRPVDLACRELVTQRYLRAAYGGVQGCRAASRAGGGADSVAVERSQPAGDRALVVVVPKGGPSDGDRLSVSLVHAGGIWRVDTIHSNAPVGP